MEPRPIFPSEPLYPAVRRGDSKRHEHRKRKHPDCDERALPDIGDYRRKVQTFVKNAVSNKVETRIEKRIETQHPPVFDQSIPAKELSKRRDQQGDQQKCKSKDTSRSK